MSMKLNFSIAIRASSNDFQHHHLSPLITCYKLLIKLTITTAYKNGDRKPLASVEGLSGSLKGL